MQTHTYVKNSKERFVLFNDFVTMKNAGCQMVAKKIANISSQKTNERIFGVVHSCMAPIFSFTNIQLCIKFENNPTVCGFK